MSKMNKDLSKIKETPKGARFKELEKVILRAGFRLMNIRGSHHVYKKGDRILTLVRPPGRHKYCHWLDVKDVVKILEEDLNYEKREK